MFDSFDRRINYLRISVTDRCNLRCEYCMPADGIELIPRARILKFIEIAEITRIAVDMGVTKVRITGGEPLVRRRIVELVKTIANMDGIEDFGMTTNAIALPQFAQPLFDAGLHRLNISLDTVDPQRYRELTRCGELADAVAGIDAAVAAGFESIKLNCVIEESSDESDARGVAAFGAERGLPVRFIRKMNLATGEFWQVEGGEGGKCSTCNRLRLSSDGKLYPCLFSDLCYDVRELGIEKAIHRALDGKPQSGHRATREFNTLGG
ncbi:MAG: radical SAM protein [Verrucomicrobia bacterium]|nr:MAG: radical SAM protein [Verrucomicrobiota bacterium]